jgi:hypothetical protein
VFVFVQVKPGGYDVVQRDGQTIQVEKSTRFTLEYAAIPCEITQGRPLTVQEVTNTYSKLLGAANDESCDSTPSGPELFPAKNVWLSTLTSIFLHGGWLHLLGNMWFLLIFGNNVEDRFGHVKYLLFYVLAGLVSAAIYVMVQANSTVPVIGASGAIAGVMGAYFVLFPRAPITTLIIWFIPFVTSISARWLLLIWFVLQFFTAPESQVAWVAHVAGFVFGAIVGGFAAVATRRPPPRVGAVI